MRIHKAVELLCKKYMTRNPYDIASCCDINVVFLPLGHINGYYSKCYRNKRIHINSDIGEEQQRFTCAHELGHAVLHPNSNTPFLRSNTLFCTNKLEIEANKFAANLLITDEDLDEYKDFSVPEIAICFGVDERLISYRLRN